MRRLHAGEVPLEPTPRPLALHFANKDSDEELICSDTSHEEVDMVVKEEPEMSLEAVYRQVNAHWEEKFKEEFGEVEVVRKKASWGLYKVDAVV
jgi:hypothetical protein